MRTGASKLCSHMVMPVQAWLLLHRFAVLLALALAVVILAVALVRAAVFDDDNDDDDHDDHDDDAVAVAHLLPTIFDLDAGVVLVGCVLVPWRACFTRVSWKSCVPLLHNLRHGFPTLHETIHERPRVRVGHRIEILRHRFPHVEQFTCMHLRKKGNLHMQVAARAQARIACRGLLLLRWLWGLDLHLRLRLWGCSSVFELARAQSCCCSLCCCSAFCRTSSR